MSDPTADAAKLLREIVDAQDATDAEAERAKETGTAWSSAPMVRLLNAFKAARVYLKRPQPAPPAGEPDFEVIARKFLEPNYPDVAARSAVALLVRFAHHLNGRLGLAARPKVEDAEVAEAVALLHRIGDGVDLGDGRRDLTNPAIIKAADLLERLAADRDGWKEQHENLLHVRQTDIENLAAKIERLQAALGKSAIDLGISQHKQGQADSKLAEREAELARAQKLICYENMSLAEQECDDDNWVDPTTQLTSDEIDEIIATAREQHAARQQQKASAEPTAREGE